MGILALTSTAMAQEPAPASTETQPKTMPNAVSAPTTTTATAKKDDDGPTDHSRVVGHVGVGYFGVTAQPIAIGAPTGLSKGTVQVPIIGARYWFSEKMGFDGGIGLNFFSSSQSIEASGTERSASGPAVMAFALHAGVPIVFATGKHYKFLAIPEANFGFTRQTEEAQNVAPGAVPPGDFHRSGYRLDLGGRVGAEIQFGFIGVPELALQASVGLNYRHRFWHVSQDASAPTTPQETSASAHANDFGTTVQSDPWAIFTNNIAALYYFP